jgi:hypothetical protein
VSSDRQKRNNAFGNERVKLLKSYYEKLGFFPQAYEHNAQGVDLVVYCDEEGRNVAEVVEATNYARRSQMHPDKFERTLRDLDWYDCLHSRVPLRKILVVSFKKYNLSGRQQTVLKQHNIDVWEIGYQNVPLEYKEELGRAIQDALDHQKEKEAQESV